jgi:SAM-dependent methyltransferase
MTAEPKLTRWRRYEARVCSDEDTRALRALLADYAPSTEEFATGPILTPADALIRLFHESLYATEEEVPADMLRLLDRLGLIARDEVLPVLVYATAAILRVAGELAVCDRGRAPDCSDYPIPPDCVYPPIFDNTLRYLASLPSTPCESMLEIGTGAGIGAVLGARHAQRVWATDITRRAAEFARLNCRLAGLDNVTVLEGDLYNPVEGLTFDRIAIHPPWAPAAQMKFAYGDGGEDGETVIAGAIAGLPRFLRPGGRFYAIVLASDREGERFEQRVRRWLGAGADRFDIAVAELSRESTNGFLSQNLARGSIVEADIPNWTALWNATRTEAIVYGHLMVRRHEREHEPLTVRARAGADRLESLLDNQANREGR